MKRLPCKTFQNITQFSWQLFYIACYGQLILKKMKEFILNGNEILLNIIKNIFGDIVMSVSTDYEFNTNEIKRMKNSGNFEINTSISITFINGKTLTIEPSEKIYISTR